MKKFLFKTLCTILLFTFCIINITNTNASCAENNDYYLETTIIDESPAFASFSQSHPQTITKTKTTTLKSADGTSLWKVSITATFIYDGTTSKCTSCSHSATTYVKSWRIISLTSHKNNNSAVAIAIAQHGTNQYSQAVTLTCSKNGKVS